MVDIRPLIGPQWEQTNAVRRLAARATQQYAIEAQAQVMDDATLRMVAEWAAASPVSDIRTLAPLALAGMGVAAGGQQGGDVAVAGVAASVQDGTYANVVGLPGDGITKGANRAEVAKPDDYSTEPEESWWQTALDNIVPDPGNEFWDNVAPDANTSVGGFIGSALDLPQTASRWALTGFQSALDFVEGGLRSAQGDTMKVSYLQDKYGLSQEERDLAVNYDGVWGSDMSFEDMTKVDITGSTSFYDLPAESQARIKNFLEDYRKVDTAPTQSGDIRANMLAGQSPMGQVVPQTALGQAVADPGLISKDSGSWLPSYTIEERKEKAALEAFDIRTVEEMARGVEPTAWTPGRGIAHMFWSPDEEAFHTWSGVVDFTKSVTLDPVNFIPMGAAGKVISGGVAAVNKGSKASLKAGIAGKGGGTIVRTDSFAAQGAAESRRGAANAAAAKADGTGYVVDDVFTSRNVTVTDDGRVLTKKGGVAPHGQYLANKQAWLWLNSGKGMRVTDDLAGRTSAYDIWKRSGGEGRGLPMELAEQLAEAKTPAAVRAILGSRIGMEIDDAGQLTKFGQPPVRMVMSSAISGSKFGKTIARGGALAARGNVISIHDKDTLIRELDAFGTAAKIPHAEMTAAMDKVIGAKTGADRYGAIYQDFFKGTVKTHLIARGVDEGDAEKLVTAYQGGFDQAQRELWTRGQAFGGGPATGHPTLMNESLSDLVQMPSYREVLRASSMMQGIRQKLGPLGGDAVGDALQSVTSDWRNLVLLRPAYTMREVGEMSFSMALSGYDSLFTHPFQAIAMVTHVAAISASKTAAGDLLKAMASGSADPKVRAQLRNDLARAHQKLIDREFGSAVGRYGKYAVQKGTYEVAKTPMAMMNAFLQIRGMQQLAPYIDPTMARVNGDGMFEELERYIATGDSTHLSRIADAMSVTHGNFIQDQASKSFGSKIQTIRRPDLDPAKAQAYARALADRLRRGHEDPEIRNIARTAYDPTMTMADVEDAYVNGTKAQKHIMFQNSRGMEEWANPAVRSDLDYLTAQEEVLRNLTGSDADLLEAMHKGSYNGKPIGSDNEEFVAKVRSTVEGDPATFPEELGLSVPDGNAARQAWDQLTTDFFQNTAAFSDVFARGPMVRQAYVKRVLELGAHMSPAAKAEIVANLRNAGDIKLAREVQAIKATGGLTVDEVDGIAAGFALKEVQRVFYDASRRQNWALAMRVASPFAQATMNTFKRWGLMSVQNPQSYYRALKPLVALQQPGSAALYDIIASMTGDDGLEKFFDAGAPSQSQANGFFYTDRYGERKFAYPLVGPIAKLLGAPEGIVGQGSLENLNVAGTSFNPGFGPVVTLAASFGLGDAISEKSLKGDIVRMLWPYGYPDDSVNPVERLVEATLPTMYKKIIQAMDPNSSTRMNTAVSTLSGLINTGDYNMQDSSEVTRLMNDADQLASRLGWWSAVFGAMTPSTFSSAALIETKSTDPADQAEVARWVMTDKLMEEYQKYTKDDYKTGTLNFVNDFGGTALFSVLPRTKTDAIAQATNDMWQFRTDNPESYKNNIAVIGLFMSNDDLGSNFARDLFMEQRKDGIRGYMKLDGPGGYAEKANEALGWMLWNKGTEDIDRAVGEDEEKRARLRALLSEDLSARFPGFGVGAKDTARNAKLWQKIRDALDDPAIQTLPSYFYVDRYIRQRDAALAALREETTDINALDVKAASPVARQLWLLGQQYAAEDSSGGFRHMWNRVLSQELDPYGPVTEEETK